MKRFFFVFSIFSSVAYAGPVKEILLKECKVFPAFKKEMVRYHDNGPSMYGVFFYDLVYKRVREVLLTDNAGYPVCDKPIKREFVEQGPRFHINEQFGNASNVTKDVLAYLAGHQIEACN